MSEFKETNPELDYVSVPFQPSFCLVTTAPNEVKTDAYQKIADDIIDMVGLEGAAYIGGGVNNNQGHHWVYFVAPRIADDSPHQ